MANQQYYEDHGRKGKRFTNNQFLFWRSVTNKRDVPALRVNDQDQIEFNEVPYIKGLGRLALESPPPGHGQYFFRDQKLITLDNVNSKSLELTHRPTNPESVMVFPCGGPPQVHGRDFVINDNILSWDGLGLDGLLEKDDHLDIFYQT